MTSYVRTVRKYLFRGVFGSLTLILPTIATSAPNQNSVAEFEVCLTNSATAFVCSNKDLSNVVLHCNGGDATSFFFKHDDLDNPQSPSAQNLETPYSGAFQCPGGEEILAVFVKSGSAKYAGESINGLPRGSGAVWTPQACPVECPEPKAEDDEDEDGNDEPDEPNDDNLS